MFQNLDFLTKDLISGFSYTNANEPRECELRKTIDGIEYKAVVTYTASAVAGFIYRVFDVESHSYIYIMIGAYSNQLANEPCNDESLIERAKQQALVKPDLFIKFEDEPSQDDVENICMACLANTKISVQQN